jgi:CBS domain-containing protein
MTIGEICTREVFLGGRETTIQEATELMRKHHVGDLIVVDREGEGTVPVGIVTDRDIVISVMALRLDPQVITLGDMMGEELVTAREGQDFSEVLEIMQIKGIRRIPVVDGKGFLVGILSVDDFLEILAKQLGGLAHLLSRQRWKEERTKR